MAFENVWDALKATEVLHVSEDRMPLQQRFFEELKELVSKLPYEETQGELFDERLHKFVASIEEFEERRNLLDPLLPAVLPTLIGYVLDPNSTDVLTLNSCKVLYALVKPLLDLLQRHLDAGNPVDRWQEPYVLLLWLNVLSQTPFQLYCDQRTTESAGERMLRILLEFLNCKSMLQVMAAKVLSSYVTRTDMTSRMIELIERSLQEIAALQGSGSSEDMFELDAWCVFLVRCFKKGRRDVLLEHAGRVYRELKSFKRCEWTTSSNIRRRKFWAKLVQRIGMVFLKPREVTWAYKRGVRSLFVSPLSVQDRHPVQQPSIEDKEAEDESFEAEPMIAEVGEILSTLFTLLKDKDTIVRWSAAQGTGRICSRLSKQLVCNVVNSIVELFSPLRPVGSWHGGCLLLAELGRRGLLMPGQLPQLICIIQEALHYDGSRAFDVKDLHAFDLQLAQSLVCVMIFDREVNCRRAASAAFQEIVGRLSIFPHGVEIFVHADYDAVANRALCYTEIAAFVAEFHEYTRCLINDLLMHRISNLDESLRLQAAQALALIVRFDESYGLSHAMPELLKTVHSTEVTSQHGAIVALASVSIALFKRRKCYRFSEEEPNFFEKEFLPLFMDIPIVLDEKRSFAKGRPLMMWTAVADLYETVFLKLAMRAEYDKTRFMLSFIEKNMVAPEWKVQRAIARAYHAVATNLDRFLSSSLADEISLDVDRHLHNIRSVEEESECVASILMVGSLPKGMLARRMGNVVDTLIECFNGEAQRRTWWMAKMSCLNAMRDICFTFLPNSDLEEDEKLDFFANYFYILYDHQIAASKLKERNVNGDVTLNIRQAAIENISEFIKCVVRHNLRILPDRVAVGFQQLITECLDCNQTQRLLACEVVSELLRLETLAPHVPCKDELVDMFLLENGGKPTWQLESFAYVRLSKLLSLSCYQYNALYGYIIAAGSTNVSLNTVASKVLMDYFRQIRDVQWELKECFENFLKVCSDNVHFKWFSVPMLNVLEKVLQLEFADAKVKSPLYSPWFQRIFYLADFSWRETKNLPALKGRISVYCCCIQPYQLEVAALAIPRVLSFLTHPLRVVRQFAAERLFEHLSMSVGTDSALMVDVVELLAQTDWALAVEVLEPLKDELSSLLNAAISG
uniref:Tubulin-specific chaperone D n=1 Tax=Trichuris muris TaxID=70415 RepID=A0A5S6QUA4_TRIMR